MLLVCFKLCCQSVNLLIGVGETFLKLLNHCILLVDSPLGREAVFPIANSRGNRFDVVNYRPSLLVTLQLHLIGAEYHWMVIDLLVETIIEVVGRQTICSI